jgi:hypothetical protein
MALDNKDRRTICVIAYGVMIGIGVVFLATNLVSLEAIDMIASDDYMTNPNIPYSELENSTFTISYGDIKTLTDSAQINITIGFIVIMAGYASLMVSAVIVPSKQADHKAKCAYTMITASVKADYCPICGIKIKDVKDR